MEDHIGYSLGEDEIKKEDVDIELKMDSPRIHCNEISRLQCHVCYKVMGHRSSLYKHLKYVHKIEPAHRLPISCREKNCYQSFTFIDPFRRHLAEQHGFDIVVEKYVFQSMSGSMFCLDFFSWKKATEQEENLRFIVSTGPRNSKGGKTHYYRCQKNGAYKPEIKKRLQSYDRKSIYNVSTTHCISSMFVFEEPECVTVEFCRTHYGHDVNQKEKKLKIETYDGSDSHNDNSLSYETVDSYSKLELLNKNDRAALVNILNENQQLLKENELFYENEHGVILKIPFTVLNKLMEDEVINKLQESEEENVYNEESVEMAVPTFECELSCDEENTVEKLEDDKNDNENSTILKSLGNGIFLDPTSNKRLKLDFKEKKQFSSVSSNRTECRRKERERSNSTMLVKEYLNEFDEKVYILEPVKSEETIIQKREKILSQLQAILMMVNSENDTDVLDDIQNYLSKYAAPE